MEASIFSLVALGWASQVSRVQREERELLTRYQGGCHCGRVKWEISCPLRLVVWVCNCSICQMKRNDHCIVPKKSFRLLKGKESLCKYTFNTHKAEHYFCKYCGVQSFYVPRSNPDGYGVTFTCIYNYKAIKHRFEHFDGQDWESFIEQSGIKKYSQLH